ncbi:BnaA04g13830D [Brassica napus]|uniref:BnaA04g13830D protein n=1 Tax=Brassica napus TaxID=3708 RepID=A0A078HPY3_BRANA|nr:BnaA04g13830D [Brassica napus]
MKYHYRNTISISVAYLFLCLFITYVSSQSLIRQITDDVNTNLKEDVPYVQKHQEISSRHYNVSHSKTVTGMRNRRPSTYSYKIETNVVDKFETRPFMVGGYNWILHVYLNGNTKGWWCWLRFALRRNRQVRFRRFCTSRGLRGSQVLHLQQEREEVLYHPRYGCMAIRCFQHDFGVDVIVPTPFEESETFSISSSSDKYTWTIQKFSTLSKDLYSPVISLGGKKWNILVVPAGSGSGRGKYVSMFLQLSTNQRRGYEYIYVRVKFRVINQSKLSNRESELRNWYGRTYSWGIVDLISFDDLRDSSKGFLVNDALIVEVQLEAISTTKYFP